MIKLLLVEDDTNLCYMVKSSLEDLIGGYEVIIASNGKEGLDAWKEHRPDIIVADIEMPVMDGREMVAKIREIDGDTPVLFASALVTPKDVIDGYQIGANNYIKKPFIAEEIDAHIRGVLSMKEGARSKNQSRVYAVGNLQLDAEHCLLKSADGKKKTLTPREAGILELFCENKGEVIRREAILSRFWETEDDFFASRSLDVFVTKLRKLFSDDPSVEIRTVRGVGLMLVENCRG